MWPIILAAVIIIVIVGGVAAYVFFMSNTPPGQTSASITGTGATFPAPLLQKWTTDYHNLYPNVTITYNALGSGAGIAVITNQTVDFGASDAPLSDTQLLGSPGLTLFPETLGGVAVTYNLAGVPTVQLNLTSDIITEIYNGTITSWTDPKIDSINPGVAWGSLTTSTITTVHRSDGSGTTYAFTNYLSVVQGWWSVHVGYGTKVTWPSTPVTPLAGSGNSGVAGYVTATPGAIGYVDVIYAKNNGLGIAQVKNAAGNYVAPTLQTILWAAGNATVIPAPTDTSAGRLRQHIVNAAGAQSYPISTYTYIIIYKEMSSNVHSTKLVGYALAKFLWWIISPTAQASAPALIYAELPANVVTADQALLKTLTWSGQQIITG